MIRYLRRTECGKPEELTLEAFVHGIRGEFMFGKNYYEHMLMLLGHGEKLVGATHMYWVEWDKKSDELYRDITPRHGVEDYEEPVWKVMKK
jgi:hypothetical protein